jgi:hypothetical protein
VIRALDGESGRRRRGGRRRRSIFPPLNTIAHLVRLVQLLVDVHRVVDHVGAADEFQLGGLDVGAIVHAPLGEELQEREDEVLVQEGRVAQGEVVRGRHRGRLRFGAARPLHEWPRGGAPRSKGA